MQNGAEAFVLDSNSILDYFKNYPVHQAFMRDHAASQMRVSVITEIELLSYHELEETEEHRLRMFFSRIKVVPFDNDQLKKIATGFRRATRCKLPDAIIAATAICLNAILVTNDQKLLNTKFPNYKARSV